MFEWNQQKSELNKKKHGVSFQEALEIWQTVNLTASDIASSKDGESRSATIGFVRGKLHTVIWTKREDKIRIISVRRARDGEKEVFKSKKV